MSLDAEDSLGFSRSIEAILRDFRLVSKLGEGGMGVVYKAHQLSLDQDVALKILPPRLAANDEFVQRFYREARMSVKLKHDNIVHGVAVGFTCATCGYNGPPEMHPDTHTAQGLHYFAMEFVEGDNLDHWLKRLGHLSVGDAVKIAIDVARALDYAHSRKILHRDVKPANIMATLDGEVKLADLGLAKVAEDDSGLTQIGQMAGTVAYMPPEQAHNAALVDGRSDIYALGTTLYVLLTGRKPFPGKTAPEILAAKQRGMFEPASAANPEVPHALDDIIAKMMAVEVSKRYETAAKVATALAETKRASKRLTFLDAGGPATEAATSVAVIAQPQPTPHSKPRWLAAALASALLSVLIIGGAIVWTLAPHVRQPVAVSTPSKSTAPTNPVPPTTEPTDLVLERALGQLTNGQFDDARATLARGFAAHPGDLQIERPLQELERGTLVLFQHGTRGKPSPVEPLWTADGVTLMRPDKYRFAIVPGRECYLYAYHRDARRKVTRIFPNLACSPHLDPLLRAGELRWLPDDPAGAGRFWMPDACLRNAPSGDERVYFVAVSAPLRDPDALSNELVGDADPLGDQLKQGLSTLFRGGGAPGEPCFVHDGSALQAFRFSYK